MINITVHKQGSFPLSAQKIKERVKKTLTDNGIVSDSEASVAIVTKVKMREYVAKYYEGDTSDHPVLSFPATEVKGQFVMPPDGKLHLGEIVISYGWAQEEARKTGNLVENVVLDLAEHGALHLIGIHHDHD